MKMIKNSNTTYKRYKAQSFFEESTLDDGVTDLVYEKDGNDTKNVLKKFQSDCIQLHFNVKGSSKLVFNEGRYLLNILEENSLLLYNPQQNLPINLQVSPNSWMVSILISIKKFHGLFSLEADYISFLNCLLYTSRCV